MWLQGEGEECHKRICDGNCSCNITRRGLTTADVRGYCRSRAHDLPYEGQCLTTHLSHMCVPLPPVMGNASSLPCTQASTLTAYPDTKSANSRERFPVRAVKVARLTVSSSTSSPSPVGSEDQKQATSAYQGRSVAGWAILGCRLGYCRLQAGLVGAYQTRRSP